MSNLRRYEILLPLKFNDGQPVPWILIGDLLVQLRRRFGAVTWETQIIRGIWQHQETEFMMNWCACWRMFQIAPKIENSSWTLRSN
jgi:hypothetical protein